MQVVMFASMAAEREVKVERREELLRSLLLLLALDPTVSGLACRRTCRGVKAGRCPAPAKCNSQIAIFPVGGVLAGLSDACRNCYGVHNQYYLTSTRRKLPQRQ